MKRYSVRGVIPRCLAASAVDSQCDLGGAHGAQLYDISHGTFRSLP